MGTIIAFIDPDENYKLLLEDLHHFSQKYSYEIFDYNDANKEKIHEILKNRLNKYYNEGYMFSIDDKPIFIISTLKELLKTNSAKLYRYKTKANYYIILCIKSLEDLDFEIKIEIDYIGYKSTNCTNKDCIFYMDINGNPYYELSLFIKR